MKILIHDYGRYPYTLQLARSLAKRGHDILYLYNAAELPRSKTGRQAGAAPPIGIRGISLSKPYNRWSLIKRWFRENEYGKMLADELSKFCPTVMICANTPLLIQAQAVKTCKKNQIGFLFWVQDLQGSAIYAILQKKIPVLGALIGKYFQLLEREQLRQSRQIVLITEGFRPLTEKLTNHKKDISVIPNWMPLDELPVRPKCNEWAKQHGLENKFCFVYTGVLGFKHKPALIVDLATRFKHNDNVRVVVVSEGVGADWLKKKQHELSLDNLVNLDFQPFELIANILGTADVLFGILEPEASQYSVPSKVASYLCAQRPILYSMALDNLAAKILICNAAGMVFPPDDDQGFISAAASLVEDIKTRDQLARNARKYAECHFDIEKITDQFERIITETNEQAEEVVLDH